jgi:very-short-patch-repair endonuclease
MDWEQTARRQDGVVARRQLTEAGCADHDVRRLVRRRDLSPLLPGVYVGHTGEPTWHQRAWAAVLYAEPAALWGASALRAAGSQRHQTERVVHVAIDWTRRVRHQPGVRVHRVLDLEPRALWHVGPPRMRTEEALVDLASHADDEVSAIALLADAVQARHTTPPRLRSALAGRRRVARRGLLDGILEDITAGTHSVLEHRYLTAVERAHGLPRGERQARVGELTARHDVVYTEATVVVELDGRLYHSVSADRFADLERDTASLLAGHVPVRLGWPQVVDDPCGTARRLAALLSARGWAGELRRCPRCP